MYPVVVFSPLGIVPALLFSVSSLRGIPYCRVVFPSRAVGVVAPGGHIWLGSRCIVELSLFPFTFRLNLQWLEASVLSSLSSQPDLHSVQIMELEMLSRLIVDPC